MARPRRELFLPDLGLGPRTIKASVWLAPLGGDVVVGDRILEIVAGEVLVDLPAPASGRLVEKRVAEDDDLHVGQVLGVIEELPPGE